MLQSILVGGNPKFAFALKTGGSCTRGIATWGLEGYLKRQPPSRVVLETCAEAFGSFLEFPSENTSCVVVAHHGAMPQIDVIHANLRSHADSLNRAGVAPERAVSRLRVAGSFSGPPPIQLGFR